MAQVVTVFREAGYEAASLSRLSEATGLKRASLYHRFPGGKEAMAEEALASMLRWADANILSPLREPGDPREKLDRAASAFSEYYRDGALACLINLFGSPDAAPKSLTRGVQSVVSALISALSNVLLEAGLPSDEARTRALRGVVLIQGALVLSRAFRDTAPFEATMARWTDELLGPVEAGSPPAKTEAPKTPIVDVRAAVAAHLKGRIGS
ncbi:TetR family transcriptional regulator [Parvularcula lutaonensis]|nr:TetR family transcriptional regulator [Parvularcula lutaonensis]